MIGKETWTSVIPWLALIGRIYPSGGRGGQFPRSSLVASPKMVVCLTITAIAQFIKQAAVPPVLLVDDLAAELDDKMLSLALADIQAVATQCFFTAIKPSEIQTLLPADTGLFHVERSH
jgi:hypothetical protein